MESLSPPPCKKLRSLNLEIPLLECRREFKLPQQFPSMMPMTKLVLKGKNVANTSMKVLHDLKGREVPIANGVHKTLKDSTGKETCVRNTVAREISVTNGVPIVLKDTMGKEISAASRVPKIFKDSMGKEISVVNDLKKMRIRSQDGRDLGEVKVKMLPPNTLLNTKNMMKGTVNKPIKFSIVSLNSTNKSANGTEELKTVEKLVTSSSRLPSVEGSEKSEEDNSKMLINKSVLLCKPMNRLNQGNNKLHNVQSLNNATSNHTDVPLCFSSTDTKQRHLLVRASSIIKNVDKSKPNENAPKVQNETGALNIDKIPMDHLELAKSRFPVVKCEKLMLPKGIVNVNELSKSSTKVCSKKSISPFPDSVRRNQIEEHNIVNKKIARNTQSDENIEYNANIQTKPLNPVIQKPQSLLKHNDLNSAKVGNAVSVSPIGKSILIKTNLLDVQRRNSGSTQIINKNIHNEAQSVLNVTNSKPVSCSYGKAYNNEPVHTKSPIPQITVNDENNVKQPESSASEQEKLSQTWNVIQKAIISVPDVELRAKALQALADCGIGVAKHVPITPPENLKTVHDSQSQTDVFGLLELENFILVRQETPTLEKIKQTQRSTFPNETSSDVPVQSKATWNSYIDNEVLFPGLIPMSCISNIDLDNCFTEFFDENPDAQKVKQILSTPHTMYKKVATQLQKDLKAIQHFNDDGMLSIHRAVIYDQLQELQRLLLVLKASKISIDVETEDGMTCLELAVKHGSSKDIVITLLQAGAKPITAQLLRESAVILASKLSSPLLPYLLQYVTDRKLLNQMDSNGFAALHYCALHGNIEGVSTLLEAGADVNIRDNRSGRTPFFHALEQNHVSAAQKLLEYGAVASIPNFSGQCILSLVDEAKSISVKTVLKQIII